MTREAHGRHVSTHRPARHRMSEARGSKFEADVVDQLVIIPVPGLGVLRLTEGALRDALAAGTAFIASTTSAASTQAPAADDPLLTPEQAAEMTGTKPSWWRQAARTGKVPCTRIGRYPRFKAADVRALGQGAA